MKFFSCNALQYVSMINQECKAIPVIMNINSNELLFYAYSILVNTCSGSCNYINNPYAKLCVTDVVKNMNIKIFNQMSIINETRHECDKSCDIEECLDYKNCKCRKKLIDKLVEKCREGIDENNIIYNANLNDYRKVTKSCTTYIVLLTVTFIIIIDISSAFFYFYWLKKNNISVQYIKLLTTYVKMLY